MRQVVFLVTFLLLGVSSPGVSEARPPVRNLNIEQVENVKRIGFLATLAGENARLLASIAGTETGFKNAGNSLGNYGLMQINCGANKKKIKNRLGTQNCKQLLDRDVSIITAMDVLERLRGYRVCRGNNIYSCYNGGPGFRSTMKSCEERGTSCRRPIRYRKLAEKYYKKLETVWSDLLFSETVCDYDTFYYDLLTSKSSCREGYGTFYQSLPVEEWGLCEPRAQEG